MIPFKYPKLNNLFVRQMEGPQRGKIIPGEYKDKLVTLLRPDYAWKFTEKIDGTNIRIYSYLAIDVDSGEPVRKYEIGGKTDAAQIPGRLLQWVNEFMEKQSAVFAEKIQGDLVFCGEGYGAGIQKGGGYQEEQKFILFDIVTPGSQPYYFDWPFVQEFGEALGFEVVPEIPEVYTMTDAVNFVRQGFPTLVGKKEAQAEGIVARTVPNLYHFTGGSLKPLRWKLKTTDFPRGVE